MTSELKEDAWSLDTKVVLGFFSVTGAVLVGVDAAHWWETLVMGAGLAVALVVLHEWSVGRVSRVVYPGLALTAAVWAVGALVFDAATSSFAFAVVASLIAFEQPRRRGVLLTVAAAFAVTVLALKPVLPGAGGETFGDMAQFVLVSLLVAFGGAALTALAMAVEELVEQLDRDRHRESEAALMRERVRHAADLHGIQDRTLQAVEEQVDLAQRFLHTDLDRVERALDGVRTLIGATSIETAGLVHSQRRLALAAELENAKNRLEAAGIHVQVGRTDEVDSGSCELLGRLLQETTANILGHAEAEQVWITLTRDGLSVVNDGVRGDGPPELGALADLRERLVDHGGELAVERDGSRFRTVATVPTPDSGTAPTARTQR